MQFGLGSIAFLKDNLGLKGERDQIKFIDLGFERVQALGLSE